MRVIVPGCGLPWMGGTLEQQLLETLRAMRESPSVLTPPHPAVEPLLISRGCTKNDEDLGLDLSELLQLRSDATVNTDVGYTLRHYWWPATKLVYRRTITFLENEIDLRAEYRIQRQLA